MPPAKRPLEEHRFTTYDGAELFYRRWLSTVAACSRVLMFQRGH